MAKVKNDALALGDTPEPAGPDHRRGAGGRGRRHAHRQHRPRGQAADQPVRRRPRPRRGGPPRRRPRRCSGPPRQAAARAAPRAAARTPHVLLFAGRIQPLKAPDVLLRAVAALLERDARRCAPGSSCPSSAARRAPGSSTPSRWPSWPPSSASTTWSGSCRRWRRPSWPAGTPRRPLVAVPSYNESFGLVAAEAQATGTPVVAAAVGGLTTVVARRPQRPARRRATSPATGPPRCAASSSDDAAARAARRAGALAQARQFSWDAPPSATLDGLRARALARCVPRVGRQLSDRRRRRLRAYLADNELELRASSPTASSRFSLPGEKKLQTPVRLDVGAARARRARLRVPQPDENHERVYRWLLERNLRCTPSRSPSTGSATSTSTPGCRSPSVDADELDRLLGAVLADRRRVVQRDPRARLRLLHPQGVGVAQAARRVDRNLEAFRGWLESGEAARRLQAGQPERR